MASNGDEGIRTPDPLLARQVLSQLSYTPTPPWVLLLFVMICRRIISNRKWAEEDSNFRPRAYQARALTG